MKTLGEDVASIRKFNRISQYELAKALGKSQPAYWKIESGIQDISYQEYERIIDTIKKIKGVEYRNPLDRKMSGFNKDEKIRLMKSIGVDIEKSTIVWMEEK